MQRNPMLDAALEYAARGWRIFPCKPGSKQPATAHGLADATTDPEVIRRWFRTGRNNIAVATGTGSIDVLDVDVHEDGNGFPAFRAVVAAGLARDAQAIVRTPSGGAHIWFRGTGQRNGRLCAHHLDFRSLGGYVLVPPSMVSGTPYVLQESRETVGTCDWNAVKDLLVPPKPERSWTGDPDIGKLADWVAALRPGNRNCGAFWAFCRAVESGADLEPLILAAVATGLPERDVRASAASAARRVSSHG